MGLSLGITGGQSRNRTTDTRIFNPRHCHIYCLGSTKKRNKFPSFFPLHFRPHRTCYRTKLHHTGLRSRYIELNQPDAYAVADPGANSVWRGAELGRTCWVFCATFSCCCWRLSQRQQSPMRHLAVSGCNMTSGSWRPQAVSRQSSEVRQLIASSAT